ncbi:Protein of unknown function [Bacillus wiedmannii]|nr:Protein of unknown function [Bacillus wiedmannii]
MSNVKAVDKEEGDLTNKVKHKGDVDTSKLGTYIVNYSVVDSQGGNATATQTVIVKGNGEVLDLNPTLTVPTAATIHVGDSFDPMEKVSATDKEDGDLTSKVAYEGNGDITKAGTFEIIYSVTDSVGNKVHAIQKVLVKDKDTRKAKGVANNSNIPNNSNTDKKESTYKELPNTGASTTNSATMGIWMIVVGTVLTLVRKFRQI